MLYVKIPNVILKNKNLTDNDKFVYILYTAYRNEKTNESFPNQKTLSEKYHVPQPAISRSTSNLVKEGYLEIRKVVKKGQYASNIYKFTQSHDSGYTIVNVELMDLVNQGKLSIKELMFYLKLKRFINDGTYIMTYTTKTEIAKIMKVDVQTVRKHLAALQKVGLIKIDYEEFTIDVELCFERQLLKYENNREFNDEKIAKEVKGVINTKVAGVNNNERICSVS